MSAPKLLQRRAIAKEVAERTFIVAKFLSLLHITNTYLCTPTLVYGQSMLPTFNFRGDVLLSERISHRLGQLSPGDIILVKSPQNPRRIITKRIVAMEGESVSFAADPRSNDSLETVLIPKGHVWIQGDNIYASHDSRNFGPVPYGLIEGKVFCRIWPLGELGSLD
ncbi:hypothetical protein V2J09_005697 [Rumex salicifolius]